MSKAKKGAPVVIVRKDKRLHKGLHVAAFMLTGGTSGVVTAAKAGTNAAYNARTRELAGAAEQEAQEAQQAEAPATTADHQRAADSGKALMARTSHAFVPDPALVRRACKFCGKGASDRVHAGR